MGGNAMKHFNVVRFNKDQYEELTAAIRGCFEQLNENTDDSVEIVPSYRNKESFGDCDILTDISSEEFEVELQKDKDFLILGKKRNGYVMSYAMKFKNYEPFQVDLIRSTASNFSFNLNYLSYNDLGNLIGRIAAALGYKFGHDGLYLQAWFSHDGKQKNVERVKEEGKTNEHAEYKKEKLLFCDFDKAIEFLGFDSNRFREGFDNIEDILKFVVDSKYFCKDYFALENRNHDQRVRDRKRATYHAALEYFTNIEDKGRAATRAEFKKMVAREFPQVFTMKRKMKKECKREYLIARRLKSVRIQKLAKKCFNVRLEGVQLGKVMQFIKGNCDRTMAANGISNSVWNAHLTELIRLALKQS